jgi:hypothetical protein
MGFSPITIFMTKEQVESLRDSYKLKLIALAETHEKIQNDTEEAFPASFYLNQMIDNECDRYAGDIEDARKDVANHLHQLLWSLDEKTLQEIIQRWEDDFLCGSQQLPFSFLAPF